MIHRVDFHHHSKGETSIENTIMGFTYEKRHESAFSVLGFTKFVKSGGELYDEVRSDGRWDRLKEMAGEDKHIYGAASDDKGCPRCFYRYTIGIRGDGTHDGEELFPIHVKESDWIVFKIDFDKDYCNFWSKDPYKMIGELGYRFQNDVGLHLDVYDEHYTGQEMEFRMPVREK
jgi:hypothetical protein